LAAKVHIFSLHWLKRNRFAMEIGKAFLWVTKKLYLWVVLK